MDRENLPKGSLLCPIGYKGICVSIDLVFNEGLTAYLTAVTSRSVGMSEPSVSRVKVNG